MKTIAEVAKWCQGAQERFSDPAEPVGQAFFRYVAAVSTYSGSDLVFGVLPRIPAEANSWLMVRLRIWPETVGDVVGVFIAMDGPEIRRGELHSFGVERIRPGLWVLNPSLHMRGTIHIFVVLYDVPDPAPWEK